MNNKYSIVVEAATKQAQRELEALGKNAEGAFDKARVKAVQFEVGATKAFRTAEARFKSAIGAIAGMAAAMAGTGYAAKAMIDAASDLAEAQNKVNVVFGDSARAVETWAQGAADDFGLSRRAALDAAGAMGNMWQQLGATTQAAIRNSQTMVELAADLSSFHNVAGGAESVLRDMQSAFRGEYDAIQKYIPTITAAAVEHEALAATGKRTSKELTALEKAFAAQRIILRDAGQALGDFDRTSAEYANSSRRLQARIEDMSAAIGKALIPVATNVVNKVNEWVAANENLIAQRVQEHIDGITESVSRLYKLYAAMPDEVVGPAGMGIAGRIIFGSWGAGGAVALVGTMASNLWDLYEAAKKLATEGQKPEVKRFKIEDPLAPVNQALEEFFGDLDRRGPVRVPVVPTVATTPKAVAGAVATGDLADLWRYQATDHYAVQGRALEYEIQADKELTAKAIAEGQQMKDLWQIQAEERWEVHSRGLDAIIQAEEAASRHMQELSQRTAEAMEQNFSDLYFDVMRGKLSSFHDYAEAVLQSITRATADYLGQLTRVGLFGEKGGGGLINAAISWVGGLFSSAHGNVVPGGPGIAAYENRIVAKPTVFPFARGIGMMGEAGAEAIMPLTRIGGDLGVKAQVAPVNITVHNNAPGAQARVEQDGSGLNFDIIIERVESAIANRMDRGAGLHSYFSSRFLRNR